MENRHALYDYRLSVHSILLIVVLVCSIIGNAYLITYLACCKKKLKRRRKRRPLKFIEKLTVHLAAMDLLLVLSSIPEMLISEAYGSFMFGSTGCKIIHPLSTYAVTVVVFNLLVIAYERWNATCNHASIIHYRYKAVSFVSIHLVSFLTVLPYSLTLQYRETMAGMSFKANCSERWHIRYRKAYTLVLFFLQYGLPVPLMVAFYFLSWRNIARSTVDILQRLNSPLLPWKLRDICQPDQSTATSPKLSVKLSECRSDSLMLNGTDNSSEATSEIFRRPLESSQQGSNSKYIKQPTGMSELSLFRASFRLSVSQQSRSEEAFRDTPQAKAMFLRHVQCNELTKRFFIVVVIFVVFSLPNQVLWLYIDFGINGNYWNINQDMITFSYLLTFTNCLLNPWIYGQWNKIKWC